MVKNLRVGYNFIEQATLGRKFKEFNEALSLIEVVHRLRTQGHLPPHFRLVGLDMALFYARESEDFHKQLRRTLAGGAPYLMQRNPVIQIVVERLQMDRQPKIVIGETAVSLQPIFGRTLQQVESDWYHSSFAVA